MFPLRKKKKKKKQQQQTRNKRNKREGSQIAILIRNISQRKNNGSPAKSGFNMNAWLYKKSFSFPPQVYAACKIYFILVMANHSMAAFHFRSKGQAVYVQLHPFYVSVSAHVTVNTFTTETSRRHRISCYILCISDLEELQSS